MAKKPDDNNAAHAGAGKKAPRAGRRGGSVLGPLITLLGALLGACALVLAHYGDTALPGRVPVYSLLETWALASDSQMLHGLLLAGIGMYIEMQGRGLLTAAGAVLLLIGNVLFSGSLYVFVFVDSGSVALVALVGAVTLLAGWFALTLHMLRLLRNRASGAIHEQPLA